MTGYELSLSAVVVRTHGGIVSLPEEEPGATSIVTLPRKPR